MKFTTRSPKAHLAGGLLGCAVLTCLAGSADAQGTREFYLYDDLAALPWSGFFGTSNGSTISLELRSEGNPAGGVYHARMLFRRPEPEAGIYIQSAPGNWTGPGIDLCALRLTFSVRSNRDNQPVEVKAFNDQIARTIHTRDANVWQEVDIDLAGTACDNIQNILAFVVRHAEAGLTVDVDDIALVYDAPAGSRNVWISGSGAPDWSYQLRVDGSPYFVKGVGYNNTEATNYPQDLALVSQMNANTLRVWSQADAGFALLDEAAAQGLMVIPAFWLLRGDEGEPVDYADEVYREAVTNSVRNWVACFKDHPAVLMWSIGNEVYANLNPNTSENRRRLTQVIRSLAQEVHALDPMHPVTYAGVNDAAFAELESTDLDLFGANSYADLPAVLERHAMGSSSKPILFLEFGCDGWWERTWSSYRDSERAQDYALRALTLKSWSGVTVGGTAFAWLDKTEDDYTGWGLVNDDRSTRLMWSALRQIYGGKAWLPRPR